MKTVHDLNQDELEELKNNHRCIHDLYDNLSDEEIKDYYSGTSFVLEDFFCNL